MSKVRNMKFYIGYEGVDLETGEIFGFGYSNTSRYLGLIGKTCLVLAKPFNGNIEDLSIPEFKQAMSDNIDLFGFIDMGIAINADLFKEIPRHYETQLEMIENRGKVLSILEQLKPEMVDG